MRDLYIRQAITFERTCGHIGDWQPMTSCSSPVSLTLLSSVSTHSSQKPWLKQMLFDEIFFSHISVHNELQQT